MSQKIEVRDLYVIAAEQGVQIRRMNQRRDSLEDIFLKAMDGSRGQGSSPVKEHARQPTHARL